MPRPHHASIWGCCSSICWWRCGCSCCCCCRCCLGVRMLTDSVSLASRTIDFAVSSCLAIKSIFQNKVFSSRIPLKVWILGWHPQDHTSGGEYGHRRFGPKAVTYCCHIHSLNYCFYLAYFFEGYMSVVPYLYTFCTNSLCLFSFGIFPFIFIICLLLNFVSCLAEIPCLFLSFHAPLLHTHLACDWIIFFTALCTVVFVCLFLTLDPRSSLNLILSFVPFIIAPIMSTIF